jgi:high-affinity iron transporter
VSWTEFLPNLLIGLREGLEAGLIVTILVSAVRRADPDRSLVGVWIGVAAAIAMSLSFGAVLTFTSASLSSTAQAVFGGTLSILAVVLVTWMVFWMRRAARTLSSGLREKVGDALAVGGTALVLTAFVAVGREGLETALFVWTNAQAAGSNLAPVVGALVGLVLAFVLCLAMYRSLVKVNLSRFFTITGGVLLVIAAGVLAYGVGDLQEAGVLPGQGSAAFDLTDRIAGGTWWVEAVRGVTNLDLRMSWLQVIAYLAYLAVFLPLFLIGAHRAKAASASPVADPTPPRSRRRVGVLATTVVAVPVLVAGVVIAANGSSSSGSGAATVLPIQVSASACAPGWTAPSAGAVTFAVSNDSGHAVDVELVTAASSGLVAEIEVLGPGTTRELPASLGAEQYRWNCIYDGLPTQTSAVLEVSGASQVQMIAIPKVTTIDLAPVVASYRAYVAKQLATLHVQTVALEADLAAGNVVKAKAAWLAAHLTYHRIGAAYGAFGADGDAVDGLAEGLPLGVNDPDFLGFHKIEYDLWRGVSPGTVVPEATALTQAVDVLVSKLDTFTFDPNDISLRAHEILEDTSRFSLTGQDDYGSGTSVATALADTEGTQTLVRMLTPLLDRQSPGLAARASTELKWLHDVIAGTRHDGSWIPVAALSLTQRQAVNAATGQVLETLSVVPDLLEIRP